MHRRMHTGWLESERMNTYLLYPCNLALLLLKVLLPLLARLIQPADEPLDVALVPKTTLVLTPRWNVVCDIDVTVLAEVFLVCDPVFGHDGS